MQLLLSPEKLKELSEVRTSRALRQLAFEWAMIFAAAALCERFFSWPLYVLTVIWVGSRQHALGVLMHDAAHYRIARDRAANDWIAELFIAWPSFFSMRSFRRNHLAHHQYTNEPRDPDWARKQVDPDYWRFPRSRAAIAWLFLKDVLGLHVHKTISDIRYTAQAAREPSTPAQTAIKLTYYIVLFGSLAYFHLLRQWAIYFLIPGLTYLRMSLHLRTVSDHIGIANPVNELNESRTVLTNPLERLLLAPNHIAYHIEHHLYPSVPFYNLPLLHRELLKNDRYRKEAHLTAGYSGLIRELEA